MYIHLYMSLHARSASLFLFWLSPPCLSPYLYLCSLSRLLTWVGLGVVDACRTVSTAIAGLLGWHCGCAGHQSEDDESVHGDVGRRGQRWSEGVGLMRHTIYIASPTPCGEWWHLPPRPKYSHRGLIRVAFRLSQAALCGLHYHMIVSRPGGLVRLGGC